MIKFHNSGSTLEKILRNTAIVGTALIGIIYATDTYAAETLQVNKGSEKNETMTNYGQTGNLNGKPVVIEGNIGTTPDGKPIVIYGNQTPQQDKSPPTQSNAMNYILNNKDTPNRRVEVLEGMLKQTQKYSNEDVAEINYKLGLDYFTLMNYQESKKHFEQAKEKSLNQEIVKFADYSIAQINMLINK